MMINNSSLCRSSNMRSATALFTAVVTNNTNVLSLTISAPVTALNNGKIRARKQITHAYQTGKSYLWQATSLLSRLHYEDVFNCHQNSDNKGITKTVTPDLYQISKSFTKTVKANIEFCTSIKRFLLLVSTQVSSENALYKWKPINRLSMLNRKVRTKYAPKTNFLMRTNSIFRHIRDEFSDTLEKANYLTGLFSFSRQVAITQAEKLVFSFFACSFICSISSWGKRIFLSLDELFSRPVAILKLIQVYHLYLHYTLKNSVKKGLTCKYTINYIVSTPGKCFRFNKTMPRSAGTLSRHLTQPLIEVMIMANRYDSAHLRARQSKLYKFYNTLTAQVVQTIATTERQARQNLGKQSLIFIARKPLTPTFEHSINWGGYVHV